MKIALFSETYFPTPDGVAHFLRDLVRTYRRMGHEARVFAAGPKSAMNDEAEVFRGSPFPPYPQYRVVIGSILSVLDRVRRFDPDVAHIHTPFSMGTAGYLIGRMKRIPVIATYHTNILQMGMFLRYMGSERLFGTFAPIAWRYNIALYRRCDAVTAPTEESAVFLKTHGLRSVKVIWNGIDLNLALRVPERHVELPHGRRVLFLGRITRDKGIYELLRAVSQIENACLVIAGIGPELDGVRSEIRRLDIGHRTACLGYVEEAVKWQLYRNCDVFCLPSLADNFPITMLEAMVCGIPIIGGDSGGVRSIVRPGENGLLVPYGDVPALVHSLRILLEDERLRRRIAERARRDVLSKYTIERSAERFLTLYRSFTS